MNQPGISRRAALGRAGGLLALAGLGTIPGSALLATPAYADPSPKVPERDDIQKALRRLEEERAKIFTGKPSPNGWEMEKVADGGGSIWTRPVPGTGLDGVAVRLGEVETLLFHVIRRFHYEIDALRKGDVAGWQAPGKVRKGLPEGNLASGTAIRIRPGHYPAGAKGGFYPYELLVIRDVLAELDGVVRWGGDDRKPDEALFHLAVGPGDRRLTEVAARLRGWNERPDAGPGTEVDVLDAKRRGAAKSLEKKQGNAA
ncbi:hypothetical protein ACFVFI_18515 [Streptomyces sp. NPDC057705]|uniref:hypothetical protein n=1 Tax=Streptomyces sp. NPDC057705 TaxID=3346222 RepID=UPI00369EDFAE